MVVHAMDNLYSPYNGSKRRKTTTKSQLNRQLSLQQ